MGTGRGPRAHRPGTLAAGAVRRGADVLEDQLLIDRPDWLDWPWVLRVLDQEVRVAGEEVRPAESMVATACLVADDPLVVTVTGRASQLTVKPSVPALGEFVARRFHLDLDEGAVDAALELTAGDHRIVGYGVAPHRPGPAGNGGRRPSGA